MCAPRRGKKVLERRRPGEGGGRVFGLCNQSVGSGHLVTWPCLFILIILAANAYSRRRCNIHSTPFTRGRGGGGKTCLFLGVGKGAYLVECLFLLGVVEILFCIFFVKIEKKRRRKNRLAVGFFLLSLFSFSACFWLCDGGVLLPCLCLPLSLALSPSLSPFVGAVVPPKDEDGWCFGWLNSFFFMLG